MSSKATANVRPQVQLSPTATETPLSFFLLPPETHAKIARAAAKRGVSVAQLMALALQPFLEE